MLGIAEGNIVERGEGNCEPSSYDDARAVTLVRNRATDDAAVDRATVVAEADDRYLVEYSGNRTGHLRVTRAGVAELGEALLGDRDAVPEWTLRAPEEREALPWWVPDGYDGEPSALDRARALREAAAADPDGVDVAALGELARDDDPAVQDNALYALLEVVEERPDDVLGLLPTLTERLGSDEELVRYHALYCVAALAETRPEAVASAADAVVALLDPAADEDVVEGATSYVSAVADAEPVAVLDAVPRLAALLQTSPPDPRAVLVSLLRIAREYPSAVLPVTRELSAHVETEDAVDRVAALGALGNVAKEFPNAAESTVPTAVELLDAPSARLRANAAGLLADLADAYPDAVQPAAPRAAELLGDGDEKVRYNATAVLARLAQSHPDAVEPAVDALVDALEEPFANSRLNACWALGQLEAEPARDALEAVRQGDPDDEVREVAEWALRRLGESPA